MKKIILRVLLFIVIINFSGTYIYAQVTRFVKQDGTGNGSSWANATGDFQGAINSSSSGDNVFVATGTYRPAQNTSFAMKEGVKIYGGFAGTETTLAERNLTAGNSSILQGNGTRVLYNNSIYGSASSITPAAVLDGFTITGGNAEEGGGMYNRYASPTITNCTFLGNASTYDGGAIYNNNTLARPVIDHCTFTNNTANDGSGGAIFNATFNFGPLTIMISNSTFSGNAANGGYGGAIGNRGSTAYPVIDTIKNCKFLNNSTNSMGGAVCDIFRNWEKTTIIGSLFDSNKAYDAVTGYGGGAAYHLEEGEANIINCVFTNNNAAGSNDDGGGAILAYGGTVNIINSTFNNNVTASSNSGSGALSGIGYYSQVVFNVINSIVYGNNAQQVYTDAGTATVNYDHSLVKGAAVTSPNLNVNPLFVDAANPAGADGIWGTSDDGLRLLQGSPAVNAGTPNTTGLNLGLKDFAGNPRMVGGIVDMGAYEFQDGALPVLFGAFGAVIKDGQLLVNWQTETETDNAYFLIQLSVDGNNWQTVQRVQSKAAGGNSNRLLDYNSTIPFTGLSLGAGLLLLGVMARRRRYALAAVVLFAVALSCSKREAFKNIESGKLLVRIVQVNKDDTERSSKVVQAVNE